MNAVEIEDTASKPAEQLFDVVSFPYAFWEAPGNKPAGLLPAACGGLKTDFRHSNTPTWPGVKQAAGKAAHRTKGGAA